MDHDAGRRALAQKLEDLRRAGLRWLPVDRSPATVQVTGSPAAGGPAVSPAATVPTPVAPTPPAPSAAPEVPTAGSSAGSPSREAAMPSAKSSSGSNNPKPGSLADRREQLEALCAQVARCTRCSELVANRTQTVCGVGNPQPRLCMLGEAPGAEEDRQGEPFVGRAGQLLNRILEACTLSREDVYILNILKCRPPGNRNPKPEEANNCREYLDRQLEILQPEFICCLGAVAAQNLLETTQPIGRLRGRFHAYGDIRVMATYHPAYLLRNPAAKRDTWKDMQMLMKAMGIKIPAGKKQQ